MEITLKTPEPRDCKIIILGDLVKAQFYGFVFGRCLVKTKYFTCEIAVAKDFCLIEPKKIYFDSSCADQLLLCFKSKDPALNVVAYETYKNCLENLKDTIMPKLSIKSIEKEEKKLTVVKKGTVFSHPYDYSKADRILPEMKRAYVGRTTEGGLICMDTIEKTLFIEENKIPLEIDLPILAGVESMEGKKAFKKYIDFGNEPFDLVNSYEEVYFIKSNFKIDSTASCNGTYLNTSFDTNEIIDEVKKTFTSALAAFSCLVEKVSFLLMAKKYGYYKFSNKKAVKDAEDFIQEYLLFVNDEIEGIDGLPKKLRKELMRFNNE